MSQPGITEISSKLVLALLKIHIFLVKFRVFLIGWSFFKSSPLIEVYQNFLHRLSSSSALSWSQALDWTSPFNLWSSIQSLSTSHIILNISTISTFPLDRRTLPPPFLIHALKLKVPEEKNPDQLMHIDRITFYAQLIMNFDELCMLIINDLRTCAPPHTHRLYTLGLYDCESVCVCVCLK